MSEHGHWDNFDYARSNEMNKKYIPIEQILEFTALHEGEKLIDVGAGNGHYSIAFASAHPKSNITALEFGLKGLKLINENIKKSGIKNVEVIEADACSYEDYSKYDKVFLANVFHDLQCKEQLIKKLSALLKPGSEMIILEFKEDSEIGPPKNIRIPEKRLELLMHDLGAKLSNSKEFEINYVHKYIFKTIAHSRS